MAKKNIAQLAYSICIYIYINSTNFIFFRVLCFSSAIAYFPCHFALNDCHVSRDVINIEINAEDLFINDRRVAALNKHRTDRLQNYFQFLLAQKYFHLSETHAVEFPTRVSNAPPQL